MAKDCIRLTISKSSDLYKLAEEYIKLTKETNPEITGWTVKNVITTMAGIRLDQRVKDMIYIKAIQEASDNA